MRGMNAAAQLIRQTAENKYNLYLELNKDAKEHQVVFIGDSLIENFPLHELYDGEKIIYNRGIAGSSTGDLTARLNSLVLPLLPDKAFLLTGTNDFLPHITDNGEFSIANRIISICEKIKGYNNACQIYVFSLLPINTSDNPKIYHDWLVGKDNLKIEKVNSSLRICCYERGYTFIDVFHCLIDQTGQLDINYTLDGTQATIHRIVQT